MIKIYSNQLDATLKQPLKQNYLLFGNEPLLKQEARNKILYTAKQQGFEDKHIFNVDNQLDWNDIFDTCQSLGLFSTKQVLILTLPDSALTVAQANALKELAPLLHSDILLILEGPKLTQKQESTQWFKAFSKNNVYTICNTPNIQQLPHFINECCKKLEISLDQQAIQAMSFWYEGNLLALQQGLLKLQLLYSQQPISLEDAKKALSPDNHYTPFQLIEALIDGKGQRSIRIARQLEAENVEIILLLRILQKELFQLFKMQEKKQAGVPINKIFDEHRIWNNRHSAYQFALQRLSLTHLIQNIQQLTQIERAVKSEFNNKPWVMLHQLCLNISNLN